jgi:hypothetical protein
MYRGYSAPGLCRPVTELAVHLIEDINREHPHEQQKLRRNHLYTTVQAIRLDGVFVDSIQLLRGNSYINDYLTSRYLNNGMVYEIDAGTGVEVRCVVIG